MYLVKREMPDDTTPTIQGGQLASLGIIQISEIILVS